MLTALAIVFGVAGSTWVIGYGSFLFVVSKVNKG